MANPKDPNNLEESSLSLWQYPALLGVYLIFGLMSLFPLNWMRAVGGALGTLYYRLAKKRVHIVRVNLQICYPELSPEERERMVKAAIESVGKWVFEAGAIWLWSTQRILKYLQVINGEIFEKALAQGNGVLLAIPHIGNWEVMGPFTTRHSEFACFYQHEGTAAVFNEFVRRRRMRNGTVMAPANATGIRRLYKHLRAKKVAGLLPDHLPSEELGVFAPFFGKLAFTGTLISSLARKNNAPVIAAAVIRTDNGFSLHFIEVDDQHSDDPVKAATGLNQAIEKCIALAPSQFQWVYPRFRRRPDPTKEPNPYRQRQLA